MRSGRPKKALEIADEDRSKLTLIARRSKSSQALATRARIVLHCGRGLNNAEVAAKLNITGATVGKWRERFRNLGSPVPVGGAAGFYQVEFFWHDPVLPGTQPYDAQYSTGSETGQTIPDRRSTAAGSSNWGALRKLYR